MLASALFMLSAGAHATNYAPNSPADVPDANPGDNVCETATGNGVCTLRAAVQESNAHAGPDSITLQANTTYLLTRSGFIDDTSLNGDLDITDSVTIAGAGAGSIIDANGSVTSDRALQIFRCIGPPLPEFVPCDNGNVIAGISGVTIQNGAAVGHGGGIRNAGMLTVSNSAIANNRVPADSLGGGIISAAEGVLVLLDSVISGNVSSSGGGIYAFGSLSITRSEIRGNAGTGIGGGGIVNTGTAIITASTISDNTAVVGGGILVDGFGQLTVVNSTISGNVSNGNGGGIANFNSVSLFNSTVALNVANADGAGSDTGGGVFNNGGLGGGTFGLTNSIVSLNSRASSPSTTFPDDCSGPISSLGSNIISTVITFHCTVNGTPLMPSGANLGPLQQNGGPTPTHALIRPSSAIDVGDASGCRDQLGAPLTTDQRGFPRPEGGRCDLGAYEASDRFFADGFET